MEREIKVKVFPGAKKEEILDDGEGKLRIFVREPAQHNLANKRVVIVVAEHMGVLPNKVRILLGHRSTNKTIEITDE